MNHKSSDDESLKIWLQQHQPVPPPVDSSHLESIIQELGLRRVKDKTRIVWIGLLSSAVAASVVVILNAGLLSPSATLDRPLVASSLTDSVFEDEDMNLSQMEFPTLNVGEDYLQLVANK